MYDSTDGKQSSILKNVDTTASESVYAHKDSVTISNNQQWQPVQAPEFQEPIIINSPQYGNINPFYHKLAQIAYNTVLRTMQENESTHGDEWLHKPVDYHKRHALEHAELSYTGNGKEDDNGHCLTRCAIVELLKFQTD